mmetsp:Transcript_26631/g.53211  ORF Transcript_26631/g.53211 Transcript_26631/m.53211 type:complete len:210 (-) Transcript_26631:708-1337(-)
MINIRRFCAYNQSYAYRYASLTAKENRKLKILKRAVLSVVAMLHKETDIVSKIHTNQILILLLHKYRRMRVQRVPKKQCRKNHILPSPPILLVNQVHHNPLVICRLTFLQFCTAFLQLYFALSDFSIFGLTFSQIFQSSYKAVVLFVQRRSPWSLSSRSAVTGTIGTLEWCDGRLLHNFYCSFDYFAIIVQNFSGPFSHVYDRRAHSLM